jgi:uncharacterized membrane protein YkvA (DUF1232 family)
VPPGLPGLGARAAEPRVPGFDARPRTAILRRPMASRSRSPRRRGFVRAFNYLAFMPLASRVPTYGRLLLALLADPRVPWTHKAILGVAVGYVLSPFDLVPESVPLLGAMDEVAVTLLAIDLFLERIPDDLLDQKLGEVGIERSALERDLAQVRRMIPRPIRRLVHELPNVIEAGGSVVRGALAAARRTGLDRRLRAWLDEPSIEGDAEVVLA